MANPIIVESKFRRKVQLGVGVTVVAGDLLNNDGTAWVKADASSQATHAQLVAVESGDGDNTETSDSINAAPYVVIFDADAPFTQDAQQYLSDTAGEITETAPPGASDLIQVVGVAHSTELIEISIKPPQEVTVTLGKPFMLGTALPDPIIVPTGRER